MRTFSVPSFAAGLFPYLRHTILQAPHPACTIAGCSAPSVRAATSLKGCPPTGRCLYWAVSIALPNYPLQCVWYWGPDSLGTYFYDWSETHTFTPDPYQSLKQEGKRGLPLCTSLYRSHSCFPARDFSTESAVPFSQRSPGQSTVLSLRSSEQNREQNFTTEPASTILPKERARRTWRSWILM